MNIIKIVNQDRELGRTQDSIKYSKQCFDFCCMDDGSIVGEYKYCNLSLGCRQIDVLSNGDPVGMEAHYLPIIDPQTKEVICEQLFCTGMHDLRPYKERLTDDKVS